MKDKGLVILLQVMPMTTLRDTVGQHMLVLSVDILLQGAALKMEASEVEKT
jgi:hypothetical protein